MATFLHILSLPFLADAEVHKVKLRALRLIHLYERISYIECMGLQQCVLRYNIQWELVTTVHCELRGLAFCSVKSANVARVGACLLPAALLLAFLVPFRVCLSTCLLMLSHFFMRTCSLAWLCFMGSSWRSKVPGCHSDTFWHQSMIWSDLGRGRTSSQQRDVG